MIVWGCASHHERVSVRRKDLRSGRRQCMSGYCPNPCTHAGMANGIYLMIGCQFHVAMWVRDPIALLRCAHPRSEGGSMNHRTIIIGCGKAKRDEESPARELYTGSLYVACRRYAEASGQPWAILSAAHGLLLPHWEREPYDEKLKLKGPKLENWAMHAGECVRKLVNPTTTEVVCLAGADYAVPFAWALAYYRITCVQPLAGMPIGLRLRWLRQNTAPTTEPRPSAQEKTCQ